MRSSASGTVDVINSRSASSVGRASLGALAIYASTLRCFCILGRVERDRGLHERLECVGIDLVAVVNIDGPPRIAFETRIEQALRIVKRRALHERELDVVLVALAGADDAVVLPYRNAAPLPFLDHFGISLLDDLADLRQLFAAPVSQIFDALIDELRRRRRLFRHRGNLPDAPQPPGVTNAIFDSF